MSTFATQVPSGSVNGTNTLFTITLNTNAITSFEFYINGLIQDSHDFTSTQSTGTATITTSHPPKSGDVLNSWIWQQ